MAKQDKVDETVEELVEELVAEVDAHPDDPVRREKAARALERAGQPAEAVKVLTAKLTNLTAHEGPPLPCLCRRCLDGSTTRAEDPDGMAYYREFAVAANRVLFFWVPESVKRKPRVAAAVASSMGARLGRNRR